VAWLKRWRRRLLGARSVTPPATGQRTWTSPVALHASWRRTH